MTHLVVTVEDHVQHFLHLSLEFGVTFKPTGRQRRVLGVHRTLFTRRQRARAVEFFEIKDPVFAEIALTFLVSEITAVRHAGKRREGGRGGKEGEEV